MNHFVNLSPPTCGVYMVGAGPGNPDLLTVRAAYLLQTADVILFADSLIPPEILQGIRPDAEVIPTADKTLEEIVPFMIERVQSGQSVIRLHSGDPSLYSTLYEQMELLSSAQIPVEVVPGISAFQAAAAHLKIELTIPYQVQTIILSRYSGRAGVPDTEELSTLASHQSSLCLYLSATHVEQAQQALLQHYPPDTPVAICFRISWPDEQIWLVPLHEMSETTIQQNLTRTVLYLVSPVLRSLMTMDGKNTEPERIRSRLYHPNHYHLYRRQKPSHPLPG